MVNRGDSPTPKAGPFPLFLGIRCHKLQVQPKLLLRVQRKQHSRVPGLSNSLSRDPAGDPNTGQPSAGRQSVLPESPIGRAEMGGPASSSSEQHSSIQLQRRSSAARASVPPHTGPGRKETVCLLLISLHVLGRAQAPQRQQQGARAEAKVRRDTGRSAGRHPAPVERNWGAELGQAGGSRRPHSAAAKVGRSLSRGAQPSQLGT